MPEGERPQGRGYPHGVMGDRRIPKERAVPTTLEVEPVQIAPDRVDLLPDQARPHLTGAGAIPREADLEREIECDGHRRSTMPPCRTDELAAAHPVGIRGVDHRQPGGPQPVVDGVQQALEDHLVDVLVRLIVPQQGS